MAKESNFIGVVLAAGSSSRMGRSKQLLTIEEQPLLRRSVLTALSAHLKTVIVVVGANASEHRKVLDGLPVEIIFNEAWHDGMGSSIRSAVTHIMQSHPQTEGIVMLACDQPLVDTAHVNKLIEMHSTTGKALVASGYANTNGIPAFFSKAYFVQLQRLEGAQGAKKIIQQDTSALCTVPFPQGEIDLDTPEDYTRFINS
jgi:molybdenum cofactor cytidylyltransferase